MLASQRKKGCEGFLALPFLFAHVRPFLRDRLSQLEPDFLFLFTDPRWRRGCPRPEAKHFADGFEFLGDDSALPSIPVLAHECRLRVRSSIRGKTHAPTSFTDLDIQAKRPPTKDETRDRSFGEGAFLYLHVIVTYGRPECAMRALLKFPGTLKALRDVCPNRGNAIARSLLLRFL